MLMSFNYIHLFSDDGFTHHGSDAHTKIPAPYTK